VATFKYAKGPVIYLYDAGDLKTKKKQILWGDWLRIGKSINNKWSEIKWGKETFAIKNEDCQEERLLEMIFLDVGQGDGCVLTTPLIGKREKIMIIDAGVGENMNGYLKYRFRDFKKKFNFHAAIITHPDSDHYYGFRKIFDNENISFKNVYHNGIMERTGKKLLGPVSKGFLTDIRASKTAVHNLYSDKNVRGKKKYPNLIWTALKSDRFDNVSMLSTDHGQKEAGSTWMPGFAPSNKLGLTIEVLGPIVEKTPNGKKGLRTFAQSMTAKSMDAGKTKNGHSVLLKLQYHDFSILFGGDLNTPAEHFLMRHYGNGGEAPTTKAETDAMIKTARQKFASDLMKCCHHGSADVTDEFLEATEPLAFVVSSGDEESHVHPRPDLLGLLGKKGRGNRPLVLCTEILRSSREKEDQKLRKKEDKLIAEYKKETDSQKEKELAKALSDVQDEIFKRNVNVYGAINVRTDGHKAIVAFRREKEKGTKRWFYYELEKDQNGEFQVK